MARPDTRGDPPVLATVGSTSDRGIGTDISTPWVTPDASSTGRRGKGMNLRPVMEVLLEYGLDPAAELAKALTEMKPVTDRQGNPVLGDDGKPLMQPVLDADARSRLHVELLQYTRPKLKAVEVTMKAPELTDEQVERRIAMLAAKAKGA